MTVRAIAVLALILGIGCDSSAPPTEPIEGSVRGLGFSAPIDQEAVLALERLGRVVSVVRSARVVILVGDTDPADLEAVPGNPHAGPVLGRSSDLELEAEVVFPRTATEADLQQLRTIGTITAQFPEYRAVFLHVRLDRLQRLDGLQRVESVWVGYDPARPQGQH